MGRDAIHGQRVRHPVLPACQRTHPSPPSASGYLESCRNIVACAKKIEAAIKTSVPELYVLGKPPGPVVAFASKSPKVNVLEVGDAMARRGWHLSGLMDPPAVHIACTVRRTPFRVRFGEDWD